MSIRSTRPGGHVGYVGVAHDVELSGDEMFFSHVHLRGGPAPVRRFLPQLVELIWNREIDPGRVPPAGFEPAHHAPEACALSPELRGPRSI